MNKRMDRKKLNIGAYILRSYARSEQHIKDLSDSGVDFIVSLANDRKVLDLFAKYGVGAIVSEVLPPWWGGDRGESRLRDTYSIEEYDTAIKNFKDHPAVWGIDIADEPSALDFEYLGEIVNKIENSEPNQVAYLNLFPNYASVAENTAQQTVSQLGTFTYEDYIKQYCSQVPLDYICFDFYSYAINVSKYYENMRIVTEACHNTGRSLWIVLQVNSNKQDEWISENMLRFQAFSSMAFGAENIIWGCYTAGWWYNNVLDGEGNKTEQYDKMKKVNREIHTIADEYMNFRNVNTHFVGFEGTDNMNELNAKPISALSTGIFKAVHSLNNAPLLVGEMVSRNDDGAVALMLCMADDPYDKNNKTDFVTFSVADGKNLKAIGKNGKVLIISNDDGTYSIGISSNEGILIIAR